MKTVPSHRVPFVRFSWFGGGFVSPAQRENGLLGEVFHVCGWEAALFWIVWTGCLEETIHFKTPLVLTNAPFFPWNCLSSEWGTYGTVDIPHI